MIATDLKIFFLNTNYSSSSGDLDSDAADICYLQTPQAISAEAHSVLQDCGFFTEQLSLYNTVAQNRLAQPGVPMESVLAFKTDRFTALQPSEETSYYPTHRVFRKTCQVMDRSTRQIITISHEQTCFFSESQKKTPESFTHRSKLNVTIDSPVTSPLCNNSFSLETTDDKPERVVLNLNADTKSFSIGTKILQWIDSVFTTTFSNPRLESNDRLNASDPIMVDITFESTPPLISRIGQLISDFFCKNDEATVSS